MIATYRVCVDQQARDEIAAAGAAHRELGPGYDDAVAEGLVERIGEEIDRRVDARLAQRGEAPARARRSPAGQVSPAAHSPWPVVVFGLGSMFMGTLAAAAVLGNNGGGVVVALIWIVIGIINVAYARRR